MSLTIQGNSSTIIPQARNQATGADEAAAPAFIPSPLSAPTGADPQAEAKRAAIGLFQKHFVELARDPAKFEALMERVYGAGHDKALAETLRQRALAGDFSWLPKIRFVSDDAMHGAEAGYDNASRTVFINQDLINNPAKMAEVFVEEAGHHLDNMLNKTDSKGDEGELFRRLIGGENISAAEETKIREFDDKGTVTVDGKTVQVENFFGKLKKAFKSVAKGFGKVFSKVASFFKPILNIINRIAPFLSIAALAIPGIGPVVAGVMKIVGPVTSLLKGDVAGALGGLIPGGVGGALGKLGGLVGGPLQKLIETGAPYLQKLQDFMDKVKNPLNLLPGVAGAMPGLTPEKIQEITGLGAQVEGVLTQLTEGVNGPFNQIAGVLNQVKEQITSLPTQAQAQAQQLLAEQLKGVPIPPAPGMGDPIVEQRIQELWNDLFGAVKTKAA